MFRDKKEKKSVVCPERYVIVEDLNLSSLGSVAQTSARSWFLSVPFNETKSPTFSGLGIIPVFDNTISPCDSDINLLDKGEPLAATDSCDYLGIRSITITLDLNFDSPN